MRKSQKEQALNLLKVLAEAHDEIKKNIEAKNLQPVLVTLADCQDAAIALGNMIEEHEGQEALTVGLLEQYCETVYALYQKIDAEQDISAKEAYKELSKALKEIEDSVNYDISIQWEVVFLPYKASMWDSLESIYFAAKEDENCNAYVIPIPYYERDAMGNLLSEHYEGEQFPDNVPITKYNEYAFEERKPDVIFIHNPYDGNNRVTSVHPFFYSSNLKSITEKLVYVPYFVTPDILTDGFCLTPGSINSDMVIVQSEKIRKNYVQAFEQLNSQKNIQINIRDIEKKIVALGSPKLEKAANCRPENYVLPTEWEERIYKKDGTKKRVIFYNTSLGSMLRNRQKYLQKLREVLKIFQKWEDVVLWWRPHPLSEGTLNSMRPELLEEYLAIVQEYCNQGWGIFDETADLYRAIAWSDGYYGDRSSVTMLFTAVQKPVLIQAVENYKLVFENIVYSNDYYWLTAIGYNGLFKVNIETQVAEYVGCFNGEKDAGRLYIDILPFEGKLVFTPYNAETIAIFEIETNRFVHIPLEIPAKKMCKTINYSNVSKFAFSITYGKYIYMFPSNYPAIIKLDMENYQVKYLYEPIVQLKEWIQDKKAYLFKSGTIENGVVRMWCTAANAFVEYDLDTDTIRECVQIKRDEKYIESVYDGENHWLIPKEQDAKVLKYNKSHELVNTIKVPSGISPKAFSYLKGICADGYLWIFPGAAEHVVRIPISGDDVEIVESFSSDAMEIYKKNDTDWKFFLAKQMEDELMAFNAYSQELIFYNLKNKIVKKKQISTSTEVQINKDLILETLQLECKEPECETDLYIQEGSRMSLYSYGQDVIGSSKYIEDRFLPLLDRVSHSTGTPKNEGIGKLIYKRVIKE